MGEGVTGDSRGHGGTSWGGIGLMGGPEGTSQREDLGQGRVERGHSRERLGMVEGREVTSPGGKNGEGTAEGTAGAYPETHQGGSRDSRGTSWRGIGDGRGDILRVGMGTVLGTEGRSQGGIGDCRVSTEGRMGGTCQRVAGTVGGTFQEFPEVPFPSQLAAGRGKSGTFSILSV